MTRIACVCALLLAAALVAPAAQAVICLDPIEFVDGLEITIEGDLITGWWRNWDGQGNDAPIRGIIRDGLPLPCHPGPTFEGYDDQNPAKAGIACIWDWGCETIPGWDSYFLFDGLDGTYDLGYDAFGDDGPPGACGIDDVPYEVLMGPCPFGPDGKGSSPGITSLQAIRARRERP